MDIEYQVLDDGPIDLVMVPAATTESSSCPAAKADVVATLDKSTQLHRILGDADINAVRNHEQSRYSSLSPEKLAEKFRMAWSV